MSRIQVLTHHDAEDPDQPHFRVGVLPSLNPERPRSGLKLATYDGAMQRGTNTWIIEGVIISVVLRVSREPA